MEKTFRYFILNALITGTLIAGCMLNEMKLAGIIIGIYYGIVVAVYFIVILAQRSKGVVEIIKKMEYMDAWKYPIEIMFIWLAINMGYHKIAVAMVFEFIGNIYIQLIKHGIEKEYTNEARRN